MEKYLHLGQFFFLLRLPRYILIHDPSKISSMNEEETLEMSNVSFLQKMGKTNVAVTWKRMEIQPKSCSDVGTLPGYMFMSSLKNIFYKYISSY